MRFNEGRAFCETYLAQIETGLLHRTECDGLIMIMESVAVSMMGAHLVH